MVRIFFNRRWWWTTLLVVAATGVMLRLGFWQLDRLAQRRAFNAEISRRLQAPPLTLGASPQNLEDPASLKYRSVIARGEYDYSQEIALVNQNWQGQLGVHLVTPLIIEGSEQAVLVDRGWIPYADAAPENWGKYAEPGPMEVTGWIRLTETAAQGTAIQPLPQEWTAEWFRVDIDRIQTQVSRPLAPVYIQQSPWDGTAVELPSQRAGLPYRSELNLDLTNEGPHRGYAVTWFALAATLGVGYVRFVLRLSPPAAKRASRPTAGVESGVGSRAVKL